MANQNFQQPCRFLVPSAGGPCHQSQGRGGPLWRSWRSCLLDPSQGGQWSRLTPDIGEVTDMTWADPLHIDAHDGCGENKLENVSTANSCWLNTLRPRQNGHHFPDDIFKCIFLNENVWIPTKISLKFVPKGPINNIPAMVQIMAWRRLGDKSLSEPMVVSLPTHICVAWPQPAPRGCQRSPWSVQKCPLNSRKNIPNC